MNWPTDPPIHPPIHLSKGGSVSTNHKSSNRIELSRLDQILLKFLWFHMFWPTDPPIHPPIHLSKGGSVSTNHKSSNRIKLSRLDQILLKFLWFHIFQPTNPPIHPPTHQKKHPPMGGELSTDSKSSNIIEISWFVQVLSRFYWFRGVPPWGVGGGGVGWVQPHTRAHTHMHACTHTHACMLNMINMAASMVAAICNFLTCLSSRFVHVRACAHV